MIYYLLVIAIVIFDRVVKCLVMANMTPWESIPIVENIFHFTYVQNEGAAFSMWQGQALVLIGFPSVVIAIGMAFIFMKRKTWSKPMLTAITFICGGGIGNLIDRIGIGYVVDLFDFRVFPVFNVADIFICVGCGLMLLDVLILDGKRTRDERGPAEN